MKKLAITSKISNSIPIENAGIVILVGSAARFGITTRIRENMATMISLNDAPWRSMAAMVTGKKIAVIIVMDIPTHAIRFFSSSFVQFKNRTKKIDLGFL